MKKRSDRPRRGLAAWSAACCLLVALGTPAGPKNPPERIPDIGWVITKKSNGLRVLKIPGNGTVKLFPGAGQTMTSSSGIDPAYGLLLDSVYYTIAAEREDEHVVAFIATNDPLFASPEGAYVGQPLSELFDPSLDRLAEEPGWACYVCLESGWAAGLPVMDEERHQWIPCEDHDLDQAKISWFFKRSGTC